MGRRIICLWAAVTTVLGGCQPPPPVARPVAPLAPAPRPPAPVAPGEREEVRISGDAGISGELGLDLLTASADAKAGVTLSDLAPAETAALLARLEPLPAAGNGAAPVLRPPTAMPPGPGTIQPIAFVAPTGAAITDRPLAHIPLAPPALEAPQILPTGNVSAESEIRVRFAETMVAVEKLGSTPADVATISPPVAGTWKWLDTRVAAFTSAAPRLAQATPYTVTVKAGTKALSGAILTGEVKGTFTTPDVTFTGTYPFGNGKVRPDAPIALEFDQDIDPAALLKFLTVTADKSKQPLAITTTTLATARGQWAKNPSFQIDTKGLLHTMVIAPASGAWPAGIRIDITLGKGAPSREGPRLTERAMTRSFETAPPFVAKGIDCGYQAGAKLATTCPATSLVEVQFSNPLDEKAFRPAMIALDGEPPTDHVARYHEATVQLPAKEGRTYTIRLADELHDAYGQPLVGTHALKITTSRYVYRPYLAAADGLYVLDPRFQIPQWIVESQAVKSLHVELYKVEPADYFAWSLWQNDPKKPAPGKRIYNHDYAVGERYAGIARVDLRPALDPSGVGHVVAVVTAAPSVALHRYDGFQPRYAAWIEVTKLGISARVDQERVHTWVHAITPAQFLKPRADVTTSLVVENQRDLALTAKTDAEAAATFELPPAPPKPKLSRSGWHEDQALLVAREGTDSAFTAIDRTHRTERVRNAQWYVTDDRFMYKPGEPVYMKGWVRWTHDGVNPGLELPARGDPLAYKVLDARNNKIVEGTTAMTDQGGFDFQF
ncbi:MAG: Ig-like domain-containing protein, partial [Kofleriaceae bacterium]